MKCFLPGLTFALVFLSTVLAQAQAPKAELVSVEKIWDKGNHNAFTDITRFQNLFYCCFREAAGHVGGNGVIRIMISATGNTWVDQGTVSDAGVDLRDPKLLVTPDEKRLYLLCGGSIYDGTQLKGRRPRYATTTDGKVWTPMQKVLSEGDWLWNAAVNPADKRFYGAVYNTHPNSGGPAPEKEWSLKTFASGDGNVWQLSSIMKVPGQPNETTLRFLKNGTAMALVRREAEDKRGAGALSRLDLGQRWRAPGWPELHRAAGWQAHRRLTRLRCHTRRAHGALCHDGQQPHADPGAAQRRRLQLPRAVLA